MAGRRRRPDAAEAQGRAPEAAVGFAHVPVMLHEVLEQLQPRPGQVVVDATIGGGGHAAALVEAIGPGGTLVGIDRDPHATAAARIRLEPVAAAAGVHLEVVCANFTAIAAILADLDIAAPDAILFDLGVSSPQLDDASRGFSYREDAPLDMRMDPSQRTTAYHLVNGLSERELGDLIHRFGEERWARRIAAFVVRRRAERGLIATTGELVDVIKAAVPAGARAGGPHPARRTFMALRIAVNNELGAIEAALAAAAGCLAPAGRLAVLSFHSLEDRIVKTVFRDLAGACHCPPDLPVCVCGASAVLRPLLSRPLVPSAEEAQANPRARSAKLRSAVRLAAAGTGPVPRWPQGPGGRRLPGLPSVAQTLYPDRRPRRHVLAAGGGE